MCMHVIDNICRYMPAIDRPLSDCIVYTCRCLIDLSLSLSLSLIAGMRTDVINNLKDTGFRGLFRYPGGCYAPFYRWKVGLLDADAQPPIETPPGCV